MNVNATPTKRLSVEPTREAVRMLEEFEWDQTSLGARDQWSAVLRSTVSLVLNASLPMLLLWGREGISICNDAFIALAGDRLPEVFGAPIIKAWPELAEIQADALEAAFRGECISLRDQPLTVQNSGYSDDIWLAIDSNPVTSETGAVLGALCIMNDTTERVRAEQRLRIAQAIGGIGTFEWHPDTGQMIVSEEFRHIWGLGPSVEVTDTLLLDLLHPEDRQMMMERLQRLQKHDQNPLYFTEYRRIDPRSGDIHWIARRGEAVTSDKGEIRRFIGICYDITARKHAEAQMRENESRWRNLFDQMQEGFFVGEAIRDTSGHMIDFSFVELNPAFEHQTGIAPSHAAGLSIREVIPGFQDDVIEIYARVLETGEPVDFELQVPALNNRWYEARARKVSDDRFAVLLLDVTARKSAEQSILESEAKFRLLAQSMPNHVWTSRANGQLDWFNERVYDFAGLTKGMLDGENWVRLVHPEDLERVTQAWNASISSGQLYKAEFRLKRHDGVYRWHIVRAVPIRNKAGDIKRWIGTNTDIDDQKSAEAALANFAATLEERVEARTAELLKTQDALRQSQKMEAIGNLTGGIAHDFNNLLQVISGNLHLIAKDMTGHPKLEERLENAIKGVTRGAKLASQLLAFGRRQPLAPKVINVGRLVNNMDDILHRALGEAITVETLIDDNLWNTEIDPGNVENAILNLAINARDAMEDNGHLTIEVRNVIIDSYFVKGNMELAAGHYVMLAVKDTGCGMSEEVLEKVFEPFFTTKPEGKGTGLGLSMVYGFVKQSGGHVIIESQESQGTTIRIYLPRAHAGEEAEPVDAAMQPVTGGHETILVAEDDDAVRDTVVAILSDLGYRVLRAKDGDSALTVLESGAHVDLLFTDMIMPGPLKSPDLARKAREFQPDIAVLFTSGYPDGNGGEEPSDIELLQKPYSREALAQKIRRVLDGPGSEPDRGELWDKSNTAAMSENPPTLASGEDERVTFIKGDRKIILLCEDDYLIRLTTAEILEDEGYTILEAATGGEALALLSDYEVDILMTDFGLPDMTGVELANRARGLKPGLPVLFATGHVEIENLPEGPTRQVTKPFADNLLLEAIESLLAK